MLSEEVDGKIRKRSVGTGVKPKKVANVGSQEV